MNSLQPRRRFIGALGAIAASRIPSAAAAEAYTLRCNVATAPDSMYVLAALRFASSVLRRSNGQLKVEVYPNGVLGPQQASVDGLVTGVLDLTLQPTATLIGMLPQFQLFDMPFLFKDLSTVYRVLDGKVGNGFFADMETKGIVGLCWTTGGFREFETTNKVVTRPEDMKGLRVRVVGAAVFVATYQALGAIPVPVDLSETFVALQQHTIDGMDISLDSVALGKYSSVIKHVAMTNHALNQNILMGSKRKIDTLPAPLQKILKEEARAMIPYQRTLSEQRQNESIVALKKEDVAFSEIQYAAFRKAVDPVYATYRAKLGNELFDRISSEGAFA